MRLRLFALACLVPALAACVPYAVGTTPATTPAREVRPSVVFQIASEDRSLDEDDRPGGAQLMIGNGARLGLDDRSDVGFQILGLGSIVATYQRQFLGAPGADRGAAFIVGGGVVGTSHLHIEGTVVASPGPLSFARRVTPYFGARVQDLTPFSGDALNTQPAVGGFFGARLGWPDLAVSPEVGVFYSPTPLRGTENVVVVPSVTLRGARLAKALGL
ncbi:hypothetical protein RQM47_08115 [Rubrivirga sp. S365]|uniref:Uncharacterized protein n=1 Tax=Rubrivirga litoralis TaxID=3075598 RepID=A0ABU3BNT5_9BACT|nr:MULTISPECIES: hypothetical protein [unclassified Rubrivirga]MDT0630959.1 hypothetical protein [Rubrivirga sp. F394]MDT7856602.1 hypothetical protein [Rubrivirga sp. S365]